MTERGVDPGLSARRLFVLHTRPAVTVQKVLGQAVCCLAWVNISLIFLTLFLWPHSKTLRIPHND